MDSDLARLSDALTWLAADAETQIRSRSRTLPSSSELAEAWRKVEVPGGEINELLFQLDALNGEDHARWMTSTVLRQSPEWANLRSVAGQLLSKLNQVTRHRDVSRRSQELNEFLAAYEHFGEAMIIHLEFDGLLRRARLLLDRVINPATGELIPGADDLVVEFNAVECLEFRLTNHLSEPLWGKEAGTGLNEIALVRLIEDPEYIVLRFEWESDRREIWIKASRLEWRILPAAEARSYLLRAYGTLRGDLE